MRRIDDLIARMTLAEKLGQLTMTAADNAVTGPAGPGGDLEAEIAAGTLGNLLNLYGTERVHAIQAAARRSRLGIPVLIGLDVIHGHRIQFPIPLAEAGLFDPEAWRDSARSAALEAAADGLAMTFAPMLDIARDPRWGRGAEGPGEDPLLASRFAAAKVAGFQDGDLARPGALAAVAKHYCGYGAVTAGREYAATDISDRNLREVHLPPFAAAVRAGVAAVMPAFTDLGGVPMTANRAMIENVLRGEFGFDGVVVSDYTAINELIKHGVAADAVEAAALALTAGVDIDMMSDAYRGALPAALERGLVSMAMIDTAVRRVLTLKEKLGLFDDPFARGFAQSGDAQRRALARDVAARAVVMLKNDGDALPLAGKCIALIGPLADAAAQMRGPWWAAGVPEDCVTVRAGLDAAGLDIRHAPGVAIEGGDDAGIADALAALDGADAAILCLGEAAVMSGEAASRAHPHLPGLQQALADAVCEKARARGIPVITVLFSGRPLIVPELVEKSGAVLAAWFLGSEAGHALADIVTGRRSPSGRLAVTWPRALGQVPLFYAQRPGGRPENPADHFTSKYLDVPNTPLFPFGHGLSYGRFIYEDISVTPSRLGPDGEISVRVDIANTGARAAGETLFLFIHDPVASVSRPVLELKDFAKITLGPGEKGMVTFTLAAAALAFPGLDGKPLLEPGDFEILVGPCADRAQLLSRTIRLADREPV